MAIFYRVETNESCINDRSGPYRQTKQGISLATLAGLYDEFQPQLHPLPQNDAGLASYWEETCIYERSLHLFGFSSISQYENWFMYANRRIAMVGHGVVAVYEVADESLILGQFQAIATKSSMYHLYDLCPDTLEVLL